MAKMYVSGLRCNARLRTRPADGSAEPLEQDGTRLPKHSWVGGRLSISDQELDYHGAESVPSGAGSRRQAITYSFALPLARIVGHEMRRGALGARYVAIDIDDGSQVQFRPGSIAETYEQFQAALAANAGGAEPG